MRQLWLKNPDTCEVWSFSPPDPWADRDCYLDGVQGLGYKSDVKTYDVMAARFIEKIERKTPDIKGTLYFTDQINFDNFNKFVGDYTQVFEFHCDIEGRIIPQNRFDRSWYKKVVIAEIDKGLVDKHGWFTVPVTFKPISIWRRDINVKLDLKTSKSEEALKYPYLYPFVYDGSKWTGSVRNDGLAAPLRLELSNVGTNPNWILTPATGGYQRARFNLNVGAGRVLIVDSNPENQIAEVRSVDGSYVEQVYRAQEADYDYINFVTIPHGESRLSIGVENMEDAVISVSYSEQKDVI